MSSQHTGCHFLSSWTALYWLGWHRLGSGTVAMVTFGYQGQRWRYLLDWQVEPRRMLQVWQEEELWWWPSGIKHRKTLLNFCIFLECSSIHSQQMMVDFRPKNWVFRSIIIMNVYLYSCRLHGVFESFCFLLFFLFLFVFPLSTVWMWFLLQTSCSFIAIIPVVALLHSSILGEFSKTLKTSS